MKSFGQYVQTNAVSGMMREVAQGMVDMGVDPWEFLLEWHRGDTYFETAILEKINLREGMFDRMKQGVANIGANVAKKWGAPGTLNPSNDPDYAAATQSKIAGGQVLDAAVKALADYMKLYQKGGMYAAQANQPQYATFLQGLQGLVQYFQQQRKEAPSAPGATPDDVKIQAKQLFQQYPQCQEVIKTQVKAHLHGIGVQKATDITDAGKQVAQQLATELQVEPDVAQAAVDMVVQAYGKEIGTDDPLDATSRSSNAVFQTIDKLQNQLGHDDNEIEQYLVQHKIGGLDASTVKQAMARYKRVQQNKQQQPKPTQQPTQQP